jgi:hypothetical protein
MSWQIGIIEFEHGKYRMYKIEKDTSGMRIGKIKTFRAKEDAVEQFKKWIA